MYRTIRMIALSSLVALIAACGPCSSEDEESQEQEEPTMVLPELVEMSATVGEEDEQSFAIDNVGDADLEASFEIDADWLDIDPQEITVEADGQADITLTATCPDEADDYSTDVVVSSNDPLAEEVMVAVELTCEEEEEPEPEYGTLTVTIEGLPGGVDADVTIEGPDGFSETATESMTFDDLEPGSYDIAVEEVEVEDETYGPYEGHGQQSVTVEAGETAEVTVEYGLTEVAAFGAIDIAFEGLPDGVDGRADITGPDDYEESIEGNDSLLSLEFGTYEITPADVEADDVTYQAEEMSVEIDSTDVVEVQIDYEVVPGSVEVQVSGLEDDAEPTIALLDEEGETVDEFPADGLLEEVAPGEYTVSPQDYEEDDQNFQASDVDITVESGETTEVSISYAIEPGMLQVTVTGLPDNDDHDIEVFDNGDAVTAVDGDGMATLSPGTYRVVPNPIQIDLELYESTEIEDVEIESGETTELDVDYALILASFHVDSTGLPDGVDMKADISGPDGDVDGTEFEGEGPLEFEDILPGVYEVDFRTVIDGDTGATYEPSPSSASYDVASGETVQAITDYSVLGAELTVVIDIPEEVTVAEGEDYEIEFTVLKDGDDFDTITADGPMTVDFPVEPATYQVVREDDDPYTDRWGNEFEFTGLDTDITVPSGGSETHEVIAPHPTKVTTEEDDAELYGSLRAIVERAQPDSEIIFSADVEEIELGEDGAIEITHSLSFFGNADENVVITPEEDEDSRLFVIDADDEEANVLLQALSLQGGDASGSAGGALTVASELEMLSLISVHFEANQADSGGALFASPMVDSIELDDVTFVENSADDGGAIYAPQDSHVVLSNVTFEQNEATNNGGAVSAMGQLEASRVVATDNSADGGGAFYVTGMTTVDEAHFGSNEAANGGALWSSGTLSVTRTLFEGNEATEAGGAAFADGTAHFENSTLSGNSAGSEGGGLYFSGDLEATVLYTTIVENSADDGPGVWNDDSGDISFGGTFITNNGTGDQSEGPAGLVGGTFQGEAVQSMGHNFVREGGDYFDEEDSDIVGESTNYSGLADNGGFTETHAVDEGEHGHLDVAASNCRDLDGNIMSYDQRGERRPAGAACSRGAWEAQTHFEDFENAEFPDAQDGYESGSFQGVDDREWHYTDIQSALEYPIDGEGARSADEGAEVRSEGIEGIDGDVQSISVQYRKAGDEPHERRIRIRIDGSTVAETQLFGDESGEDDTIRVLEVDDLDEGTDFELSIENDSPGGTGDITIDNISWR